MCGIAGFMGQVENRADVIRNMTEVITHRGPDSDGFFTDDNISMGFRRLSIIDLGAGHQPIYNEDKSLVLTFNGEIYNYKDLRKELIAKGHKFYTDTDSEVLVHGFEEWKEDMLPKLRGMFGFAIYNTKDNSLFIARDFFGIKPMHYTQIGNDFVYASEIKSILEYPKFEKKFNRKALDSYLSFQYAVPPETFFEGVYCLMPGHYLWYKDGEVETTRYFEARFNPDEEMTEEEAVDRIEKVFENSVNAHKIADVEVGCFLSSGVDSSYVAATFNGDKTFTVGFDYEKYNEIDYAKALSEKIKIDNYSKLITTEEYWDAISHIQYQMDEPLADPSAIALYFVSQTAAKHVKVAMSGEGADEFFGGYNIYHEPFSLAPMQKLPKGLRKGLAAIAGKLPPHMKGRSFLIRASKDLQERFIGNAFMFNEEERAKILKHPTGKYNHMELTRPYYDKVANLDDVTKMQYIDIHFWLIGDILLKADKMSMAHSLEVRVPFLDKEVFEVARHIPTKYKVNNKNTKFAMRQAAHRYLPDMVAEKKKLGFPVPIRIWLRDDKYYNIVRKAFTSDAAQEYFNVDEIVSFLDEHKAGNADNSRKIWTIYMFLVWYEEYFGKNEASHVHAAC